MVHTVKLLDFKQDNNLTKNLTFDEFKSIVSTSFKKLIQANTLHSSTNNIGCFISAHSGKSDKFVAIENIELLDSDLEYLYFQDKQYLLLSITKYNSETNELFDINDENHIPKIIQSFNPSRPAIFFYSYSANKSDVNNLVDDISLYLTSNEIQESRELHIKQEIDTIFREFNEINSLLIFNNSFFGNFDKLIFNHDKYSEYIFRFDT